MAVTITRDVIGNPFFVYNKARLYRFVGLWLLAVEKQDSDYDPYPEDDNPETKRMALDCGWIVEDKRGQVSLTGPDRKPGWLKQKPSKTSTYIVEAVGTGTVKIGRSRNVGARISSLQTSSSYELKLVAVIHDDVEYMLHKQLAAHRVSGEWFRLTPEVQSVIDAMGGEV